MSITPEQVKAAWLAWQMEESRDKGYDFNLVQQLKQKYYSLKEKYERHLILGEKL